MNQLSLYAPSLDGKTIQEKKEEILEYFTNTYELFEKVFDILKDDAVFYQQSDPARHPMIFYFGHTATFFINKLINMKIISQRVNPQFESIFAIGVDEMVWDDMQKSHYNWPSVQEVRAYRKQVKELVRTLILNLDVSLPIVQESDMWIILMGIEHERIHIETSLVLHRQIPLECIQPSKEFKVCQNSGIAPKNEMIKIAQKSVELGKHKSSSLYGWDNEYGQYKENVASFEVSKYLVSNAEFLEFVHSGGYTNEEYWDEEGKAFLKQKDVKHPSFWIQENGTYRYRTLDTIIDMPQDWPVDVNALEAEAFCRYKSKKESKEYTLLSESEYMVLYENSLEDEILPRQANLNFNHYASASPVNEFAFTIQDGEVLYDVVGNVWQWSRTPMRAFKGFKVHEAYDDFSTPTFDEKHALILGASWASSGNIIMKHSRYAFRKHFYQNAGFRYVITQEKEKKVSEDIYESDALVAQYCEFQYGETYFGVENFAVSMAKIANSFAINTTKALDLGCATGRATFELAKVFNSVEGIDFSARFIQVGTKLQSEGYVAFRTLQEGELFREKKVTLQDLAYEDLKNKVSFWQGDACNLKENFKEYDLVIATNLIDRLYNPKLFLQGVENRLNKDGILIISSPYTWQESSTKKEFWLGGYKDENGVEIKTIESLKKILSEHFELLHTQDVPFVIQETARKFQHTISQVSVWKKR